MIWYLFGFSVQWHINPGRLCNAKTILVEKLQWYYKTMSDFKSDHNFASILIRK